MARRQLDRAFDLGGLGAVRTAGSPWPFAPLPLEHIYVKLDFKQRYENAGNAEDARGFLRSVTRAGILAHRLATRHDGQLLELQGSTLHVGIPSADTAGGLSRARVLVEYVAALHAALRAAFHDPRSRVEGWRMTVDGGRTLVVAGRGVHGDASWVSLGTAANRPAKHLYSQLYLPERLRALKRFTVGVFDPHTGRWRHEDLDSLAAGPSQARTITETLSGVSPQLDYSMGLGRVLADALPIGPRGTPLSPSVERPDAHFGWVLRADLDGFTARVDRCFGDDGALLNLAEQFYGIMDAAADFVGQGTGETLAQLPWAGDNFTVAAVFPTHSQYREAIPRRLVELSLDFEKEMAGLATGGGFAGRAHGVAGGEVHGNAGGNVYLAGAEVEDRRFLVGAGEGFGRSTQAFTDLNPRAGQLALYTPDWHRLAPDYQERFRQGTNQCGEPSTLYRVADIRTLLAGRAHRATVAAPTIVTLPQGRSRPVATRPYMP